MSKIYLERDWDEHATLKEISEEKYISDAGKSFYICVIDDQTGDIRTALNMLAVIDEIRWKIYSKIDNAFYYRWEWMDRSNARF